MHTIVSSQFLAVISLKLAPYEVNENEIICASGISLLPGVSHNHVHATLLLKQVV